MASNTPKRGFGRWLVLDDIVNIWADLKFKQKVKVGAIESGKKNNRPSFTFVCLSYVSLDASLVLNV